MKPTYATLKTYTGEKTKPVGVIPVFVEANKPKQQLNLLIAPGDGPSLFGCDWLAYFRLDWSQLHRVHVTDDLFSSFSGGQEFTKLDLAHAYLQVPLEEDSSLKDSRN